MLIVRWVRNAAGAVALAWAGGWGAWDAGRAWALMPEQVALIVNGESAASRAVADFYAKARHIPADHLITVRLDARDDISEVAYKSKLVEPVRRYLLEHKLDKQVTCLVTTFDVPLRVGPKLPAAAEQKVIDAGRKELVAAMESIQGALVDYDAILPATITPTTVPSPAPATAAAATSTAPAPVRAIKTDPASFAAMVTQLQKKVTAAGQRIGACAAGPARLAAASRFRELQENTLGWAGAAMALQSQQTPADLQRASEIKDLVTHVQEADARMLALAASAHELAGHEKSAEIVRQARGQAGLAGWLEGQLAEMQEVESDAAVDNELMMLWVDKYPRARWLYNPRSVSAWVSRSEHAELPHLMMVSRLDGATPQGVMDMITTSMKTEEKGLDGVMYLDARGKHGTDAYGVFDNDLRATATYLRDNTNMKVVLDDTPFLLEAKNCPDAALYCGWYALRSYHDSCQWLPGAVGYHVASMEMVSLHGPKEQGWAVNLLKHGFGGTLGAVSEPYLHAFPSPSLFFPLLLSGQYTQTEVYTLTCPLMSWRIAWVGDPLYNPFKARPRITVEQLRAHPILRHAAEILPPGGAAGTMPAAEK